MVSNKLKKVNIRATVPVRNVTPPIYGVQNGIMMSQSDILKCLCRRAVVYEILEDGTPVRLTTKNFRDDNSYLMKNPPQKKVEEKKEAIPETPAEPVSDDDGYKLPVAALPETLELRTYIDGSQHICRTGEEPVFDEEDQDEDEGEPEEASNVMEERTYIDGITRNVQVGACPIHTDPEDGCPTCHPDIHTTEDKKDDGITKKTTTKGKTTKKGTTKKSTSKSKK